MLCPASSAHFFSKPLLMIFFFFLRQRWRAPYCSSLVIWSLQEMFIWFYNVSFVVCIIIRDLIVMGLALLRFFIAIWAWILFLLLSNCHKNPVLYRYDCPVGWGCRIHWLHLCRGIRSTLTSVLDMTLNNLMVRFQQCWSFGECGVPLHCHCSQVHSGPEW